MYQYRSCSHVHNAIVLYQHTIHIKSYSVDQSDPVVEPFQKIIEVSNKIGEVKNTMVLGQCKACLTPDLKEDFK